MFGSGSVSFCGSRRLPVGAGAVVSRVVGQVMAGGHPVQVGCALGADAQVVNVAVLLCPSQVAIHCAFGPSGQGAVQASNVGGVRVAATLGVQVSPPMLYDRQVTV